MKQAARDLGAKSHLFLRRGKEEKEVGWALGPITLLFVTAGECGCAFGTNL
jgi:hypothetical protein